MKSTENKDHVEENDDKKDGIYIVVHVFVFPKHLPRDWRGVIKFGLMLCERSRTRFCDSVT